MHTYSLTLCYDGGRYRGWQRQGNTDNTIQARVEAALGRVLGTETEVAGSGAHGCGRAREGAGVLFFPHRKRARLRRGAGGAARSSAGGYRRARA